MSFNWLLSCHFEEAQKSDISIRKTILFMWFYW